MYHSRKAKSRLRGWIAVVFACANFVSAPTVAFGVDVARLLPIGDSITYEAKYVAPLQAKLREKGYDAPVIANEGTRSITIGGLDGNINTRLDHPNVNDGNTYILLMVGINDLARNEDVLNAPSRLGHLITNIRTIAPLANLIVAQISPDSESSLPGIDAMVRQYNQDIVPVIQGCPGYGTKLRMVDMYSPFISDPQYQSNPLSYFPDGVHPNQAGGDVMAGVWYRGITVVPEPNGLAILGSAAPIALLLVAYWQLRRRLCMKRQVRLKYSS
jgi:lysophospholipase L1-like esterase